MIIGNNPDHNHPYPSRHNNITLVPGHDDFLLRWFPRDDVFDFDLFVSVEQAIMTAKNAELHFDFIRNNTDIRVPRFHSFIAERTVRLAATGRQVGVTAIFSLVELKASEFQAVAFEEVAPQLAKYYSWIVETAQPVFLKDLLHDHQYARDQEGIWLFDIEPQFDNTFLQHQKNEGCRPHINGYLNRALVTTHPYR